MRRVYAIGETVLDIIFKDGVVQDSKPGGSMLNTAVSLGRAGLHVSLITEFAKDQVGMHVRSFLEHNGVDCQYVYLFDQGKTSLALAFLDDQNDASYVFYKNYADRRLQFQLPDFDPQDILLFGSFFGIDPAIRRQVMKLVARAKEAGCLIIYDPNFRKPHAHQLNSLLPIIRENMAIADMVRGSHEDFQIIFQANSIQQVRKALGNQPEALVMTQSSSAVYVDAPGVQDVFPVKKILPLSTIGAGDNFNAGLIFGLIREGVTRQTLSVIDQQKWERMIGHGIDFASDVCMSYENYISESFVKSLK